MARIRRWKRPRFAIATAALLVIAGAQGPLARADTPLGVAFGKSKFTSSVDVRSGEADDDVFVAALLAGERLTVTLSVAKKSALQPELSLLAPDGTPIDGDTLGVKANKKRTKLKLSNYPIPTTGVWGVRVSGDGSSAGAYALTTKIAAAAPTKIKNQVLDAAGEATHDHLFGGIDGALFSFDLVWKKKQSAVRIDAVEDPQGDAVPGATAAVLTKGANKLRLAKAPLATGAGTYLLRTAVDEGTATYSITYTITPQSRPDTGKKPVVVSSAEPILEIRSTPLMGLEGSRVRVTGSNFSTAGTPSVFFGDTPGTGVTVGGGGGFLDVDVPAGVVGSRVALAVQNPDGQASRRAEYFWYPPPPVIAELRDGGGVVRRGGATAGGQSRRVLGENLFGPVTVTFGGNSAVVTDVASDGSSATVTTPPGTAGESAIVLTDTFGRTADAPFTFTYKVAPAFAATPYDPPFAAVAGGTTITLTGSGFEPDDVLRIGGVDVPLSYVDPTRATFGSPARGPGSTSAQLVDRVGTVVAGPAFVVVAPPTITAVTATAGPSAGPGEVPLGGGTTMRATGTGMRATNTVTLDGAEIGVTAVTATSFDFTVPASSTYGGKTLAVTDPVAQRAERQSAVTYVGFSDATATRAPAGSTVDNFGAFRGALGDLDGGGTANDLVIGSYDATYYPPGTRVELTRVLLGNGTVLQDKTASNMPAAFGDPTGVDPWLGGAVAIGDVDGSNGADIVTAGPVYDSYYGAYYDDVRIFRNNGSGSFTFDATNSAIYLGQDVTVYDTYYQASYPFFASTGTYFGVGESTALALGDLDADNDLDVVVGTSRYRAGVLYVPQSYVDTSNPGNYTANYYAGYLYSYGTPTYQYAPALLIFDNDIANANGLVNVSFPRLPLSGTAPSTTSAFPATDVALGDIDRDNDLDIVLTWPDPLTTTPYGQYTAAYYGSSYDSARVSTAVLTNDGKGFFTDATATWLPAVGGNEFWQGHRLALADLDRDGDLDLVIVHGTSIDAYTAGGPTYTTPALRILRNDGAATGFTDVTSTALPSVPLPGTRNDNLRGVALAVKDVNRDGRPDILVGTYEPLDDANGNRVRATRLLFGRSGSLSFALGNEFLPPPTSDSGEADDLLLGDLAGRTGDSLILLTESYPDASTNGEYLRVFDWNDR